jgi:hypothetical protein
MGFSPRVTRLDAEQSCHESVVPGARWRSPDPAWAEHNDPQAGQVQRLLSGIVGIPSTGGYTTFWQYVI